MIEYSHTRPTDQLQSPFRQDTRGYNILGYGLGMYLLYLRGIGGG